MAHPHAADVPARLGAVPARALPLHVFEPRYRALVEDCLAGEPEFGVVLIERGSEVGGGDTRFDVGTVARIVEAAEFPDGRYALVDGRDRAAAGARVAARRPVPAGRGRGPRRARPAPPTRSTSRDAVERRAASRAGARVRARRPGRATGRPARRRPAARRVRGVRARADRTARRAAAPRARRPASRAWTGSSRCSLDDRGAARAPPRRRRADAAIGR